MKTLGTILLGMGAALAAVSFSLASEESSGGRMLQEKEIRDFTAGRTFHYLYHGEHRGDEQHHPDGKATWRLPDGTCYHGVWIVEGPMLCYYYGSLRYGCWHVTEQDDRYRHIPLELDGTPTGGEPVLIEEISEEPVGCTPQQLS